MKIKVTRTPAQYTFDSNTLLIIHDDDDDSYLLAIHADMKKFRN